MALKALSVLTCDDVGRIVSEVALGGLFNLGNEWDLVEELILQGLFQAKAFLEEVVHLMEGLEVMALRGEGSDKQRHEVVEHCLLSPCC